MRKRARLSGSLIAFVLLVGCGFAVMMAYNALETLQGWHEAPRATMQAEERLTTLHASEVEQVIEDFLRKRHSLTTLTNPDVLLELETGLWLELSQRLNEGAADEPYWLVSRLARVERVQILEYSSEKFKALACVTRATDKLTLAGEPIKSYPARLQCGVYVFLNEDGVWKHAGYFDTTDIAHLSRNWAIESEWLKEIIGELPDEAKLRELRFAE